MKQTTGINNIIKSKKFIIFLGVDGVGKSSIIDALTRRFHSIVYKFHFCPTKRYNPGIKLPAIHNPHAHSNYNVIISIIKIFYLLIAFNYGYLFNIKRIKKRNIVIGDRYFYDLLVDPWRYRVKKIPRIIQAVIKIIPKPDYVFVLIGNTKVIHERKNELDMETIIDQQEKMILLAEKHRWIIVDTSDHTIEAVTDEIMEILRD